jgi:TolB-like protein
MVGYTALMQEDEEGANEQRMRQREVLAEVVPRHNGKILQHYGDGSLSVFGSAVEAVECAVAIQAELRKGPGVPLRIGVHTGDIVYDDGGIYGDGVNVASRIEGLSAPGGILITGKVLDDIKNHPSLSTSPMGEVMLKNVKQPQRVFAITNEGLTVPSKEEVEAKAEGCTVVVRPAAGMEVMEFAEDDPGAPLGVGEALLKRIKDRAMVPWGMIYLGVAWVLVEVVKFMAGLYGWDPMVQQSFALVAFSGFLISLVVAWYHGERGRQHLQRNEVVIYIALIMATGGALTVLPSSPTSDMPGLASIGSVEDERPSVAVLPFDNLSDDGENVYFASGLHDEVLTQLQRVAGLRVISRTSVMEYADVDDRPNARVIADNLGVSHLTEATIQRVGDQLRVNIQLIDARTDDHVWAQSYDRQVRDAFDVQSDIAITIAGALATSLTDAERGAITHPPTTDPEAYRLYLQGLDYMPAIARRTSPRLRSCSAVQQRWIRASPWCGRSCLRYTARSTGRTSIVQRLGWKHRWRRQRRRFVSIPICHRRTPPSVGLTTWPATTCGHWASTNLPIGDCPTMPTSSGASDIPTGVSGTGPRCSRHMRTQSR